MDRFFTSRNRVQSFRTSPLFCINILGVSITHYLSRKQYILEFARFASISWGSSLGAVLIFLAKSSSSSMLDL